MNDNEWHVIDIKFNRGSVSLKLDDFIEDYVSSLILMLGVNIKLRFTPTQTSIYACRTFTLVAYQRKLRLRYWDR